MIKFPVSRTTLRVRCAETVRAIASPCLDSAEISPLGAVLNPVATELFGPISKSTLF
jgi:hypothetical protein